MQLGHTYHKRSLRIALLDARTVEGAPVPVLAEAAGGSGESAVRWRLADKVAAMDGEFRLIVGQSWTY